MPPPRQIAVTFPFTEEEPFIVRVAAFQMAALFPMLFATDAASFKVSLPFPVVDGIQNVGDVAAHRRRVVQGGVRVVAVDAEATVPGDR